MANQQKNKKEKIDFKYNFSVYFGFLKKYKFLLVIILILVLLLEASSVADKLLFKFLIDKGTEFTAGNIEKTAIIKILMVIAIGYISLIFLKAIFKWFYLHLVNKLDSNLIIDLKRKFFSHLIDLSHSFHTTHKTGSLISRLIRGGSAIERMTDVMVFNVIPLIFQLIIITISLIYFSLIPAIVLFITASIFIVYSIILQSMQKESNLIANDAEDIEKANISDIFSNIDSIRYFGKEELVKNKFKKLSENTKNAFLRNWNYFRWLDSGQSLIIGLGTLFLLYFPILSFIKNEISLGTLVFIYTLYGTLISELFGFVHGIRQYYRAMADFDDLFQYGKIEKEVKDKPNAQELKIKEGGVEFDNVTFSYGKRKIFSDFSLKIPKNKRIALVGHSGCGKTTLIKLLYRMYDLNSGNITIDNKDITNFKQESLRAEMSIVPQECVLFDESIYDNILFSNPKATKEEVMRAIKFAQLDDIIKDFPNKEKTIVGERGVKLSGGEKQRVSIARAILANKKILVLDEATSSLDSETEHEIQIDLEKLMQGRTSIVIAHRLSTIMKSDIIVVMKKGKIVQMGKHEKLINEPGEYQKLWNLQRGGYIK